MKIRFVLFLSVVLASCGQNNIRFESKEDITSLMEADRAASKESEQNGFNKSMLANVADSAVLLRPSHVPLKGTSLKNFLQQDTDSTFILSWQPDDAVVAASGELGFTYGIYTLREKKDGSIHQGTYATIWKRENKGKWKILLDTGNPGIKEELK